MKHARLWMIPAVLGVPFLAGCALFEGAPAPGTVVLPLHRSSAETASAHYEVGRFLQGQGRYEGAAQAYCRALAIQADYAEARNGLAVVRALQGRIDDAIHEFVLALASQPKAAYLHGNLGYAQFLAGRDEEAISSMERALALDPDDAAVREHLLQALRRVGNVERAAALAATLEARSPAHEDPQSRSP